MAPFSECKTTPKGRPNSSASQDTTWVHYVTALKFSFSFLYDSAVFTPTNVKNGERQGK